jgi:hypothetical protein
MGINRDCYKRSFTTKNDRNILQYDIKYFGLLIAILAVEWNWSINHCDKLRNVVVTQMG